MVVHGDYTATPRREASVFTNSLFDERDPAKRLSDSGRFSRMFVVREPVRIEELLHAAITVHLQRIDPGRLENDTPPSVTSNTSISPPRNPSRSMTSRGTLNCPFLPSPTTSASVP
jgi:hypothetical protein